MKQIKGFILLFLFTCSVTTLFGQETVKDRDGNVYKTIKVGKQVWMAENLKVTHYRNGEAIPSVKEQKEWDALTSGAYSDVTKDPAGPFYNWYVIADQRNICPLGWHVPSEPEWIELITFLAGEKLSPAKASAKLPPATKSVNDSLFKLLPENFRGYELESSHLGYGGGGWWTSTSATAETAYYHSVNYDTASKNRLEGRKRFGYNIRCIKSEL